MGRGSREQRDFGKRAARGDPRALRDFATGKVPLPKFEQSQFPRRTVPLKTEFPTTNKKFMLRGATSTEETLKAEAEFHENRAAKNPNKMTAASHARTAAVARAKLKERSKITDAEIVPDKKAKKIQDGREAGAKSAAQRAKITKQQIKHDPKAPTPKNEPRAPGAGIPKKGFTKAQFNKIYKAPGGTGVTRGGGGGGPAGTPKLSTGVFNPFKRK